MTEDKTKQENIDDESKKPEVEEKKEDISVLKEKLAVAEKKANDFELAFKKAKNKSSKEGESVNTDNFVTKEDLFFMNISKDVSEQEDKNFIKAYATSQGISLEEAYANTEVQTLLGNRKTERISANVNSKLQNNEAHSVDIDYLSDEQFKKAFESSEIEHTPENIQKYSDIS